ncbi:MAG: AtpZ/AtpI family protein [bacterium]|nr:AtpZ/AtpI family protein [bacterium]
MDDTGKNDGTWTALGLAFQLGYLVAIPIVVFAFIGRTLDARFGTSPWFLLGGILLSLIASSILVVRKAKDVIADGKH